MLNGEVHWWINIFRNLFTALDELGYMLLGAIFDVFFTVANAKILQGDFIVTFYGRVQLILGVFMVFRLSITLLQIIVNPDLAKDKNKGASKILMRIVLSLVMLTLIAPINIPNDDGNPLNQQIADNGILFGFLYQIQNSVVQNNVLGKLILGSSVDDISSNNNSLNLSGIANIGDTLSATVAKMFITPALKEGVSQDDITDDEMYKENLACEDLVNGINYFDSTIPYQTLLTGVRDLRCSDSGANTYAFDYTLLGGAVVSIVMFLIILGFTVDIAVRAIKLALLRLIAPIPIIAYMDPGQEKNGAFGSWVKTLTSTYLDLFVRLIIIYFGIYIIVSLTQTTTLDLFPSSPNFFTSAFATIFIIIGILVFMKQAPKFFKDMLGIKGDGNFKLFGGLGTIAAAGLGVAGIAGSIATNYRTKRDEVMEDGGHLARTRGVFSGIAGGIGGAVTGARALATADKNAPGAVFSAMQRRNAIRAEGVTGLRRAYTGMSAALTGQAPGAHDEALLKVYDELQNKATANKNMMEEQTRKSSFITGKLKFGPGDNDYIKLNYTNFENRLNNARARGETSVTVDGLDYRGNTITKSFDLDDLDPNAMNDFFEDAVSEYGAWQKGLLKDPVKNEKLIDKKLAGTVEEYQYAARTAQMDVDGYDYKGTKGTAGIAINEKRSINASRKSARYRAAARHVGAPPPGGGPGGPRRPH